MFVFLLLTGKLLFNRKELIVKEINRLTLENVIKFLRGIINRNDWDKKWHRYVSDEVILNTFSTSTLKSVNHPYPIPEMYLSKLRNYPKAFQKAGEKNAWLYLNSFCINRGKDYSKYISKPTESRKSCGRISPFLAWGNLSIRQAFQYVINHPNYTNYKKGFRGMLTRLKWHCHFIQKFETECTYETECINKGYESMEYSNNPKLIEAWEKVKQDSLW